MQVGNLNETFGTIRAMFGKLRTITWFTAVETLTHPATLLVTLAAVSGTLILPLLQFQRFSEDGRLARDCGLATALLLGLFFAIGGAGRLYRALTDGTSAVALVKPLSRTLWFCGHLLGTCTALLVVLLSQGIAILIAEAYSPQYHSADPRYADVGGILLAEGLLAGALLIAALLNRFRAARFPLAANLLMPCMLLLLLPFLPSIHWGNLTALLAILFLLLQLIAFAGAVAIQAPTGLTATLTLLLLLLALRFFNASAYLPLDALAKGGTVSLDTLLLLLPQTLFATALFIVCGASLLKKRAI